MKVEAYGQGLAVLLQGPRERVEDAAPACLGQGHDRKAALLAKGELGPGVVLRLDPELDEAVARAPPFGEPPERRAVGDLPLTHRPHVEMRVDVHRADASGAGAQQRR